VFNPSSKFVRVNNVIASLQKLHLLPEELGSNEASIEEKVAPGVAGGGPRRDKSRPYNRRMA
jgi:hypothetical protein